MVECDLAKVDVAGSNPVSRSKFLSLRIAMIKRFFLLLFGALLAASLLLAQDYKLETITTAAPGLPAAYAAADGDQGIPRDWTGGPVVRSLVSQVHSRRRQARRQRIVFPIAQGTLLGILRFPARAPTAAARPDTAGVYTMRYSNYPVDGAHQGVAPQRDFALLTPIAGDPDPNATPDFDALVKMSTKASGTPHPAVLSIEPPAGSTFPAVTKEGDHDWVLNVKIGDLPFAIIVAGKVEA